MGLFDFFSKPGLDLNQPKPSTALDEVEFLALDFETTGVDAKKHEIVSMGWVPVKGDSIDLSRAGYLVVSGAQVGESATVHMLTDADLAAGIPLTEALDELLAALDGKVILAHFAALEVNFLTEACQRIKGAKPKPQAVDTFAIERRHMERMATYPRGEDLRLARVRQRYDLPAYGNHNALTDALACAELFLAQRAQSKHTTLGELTKMTQA